MNRFGDLCSYRLTRFAVLIMLCLAFIIYIVEYRVMSSKLYQVRTEAKEVETELIELRAYIPNICEIQQKLNEAGYYDGSIDGIWGEETDRAYCNWAAAQHFK